MKKILAIIALSFVVVAGCGTPVTQDTPDNPSATGNVVATGENNTTPENNNEETPVDNQEEVVTPAASGDVNEEAIAEVEAIVNDALSDLQAE